MKRAAEEEEEEEKEEEVGGGGAQTCSHKLCLNSTAKKQCSSASTRGPLFLSLTNNPPGGRFQEKVETKKQKTDENGDSKAEATVEA